ncbi:hypothetical protein [Humisphaera borealis]|uniref:Uncharacterized protein n=1 Tax=Humisphaera borealis TaxID=2807512 RepID=A0A7M2WUN2_9BACT|nr:hypothetical protein [Humisphaera borealis]QOV88882.1 hypothetical protein IPV69_22050 [Humisphaera borealis]
MRRFLPLLLLYPSWLAFLAVHELGHVLHALWSGATGIRVDLPLFGFSRTNIASNPSPLFVAWGGVIWGTLLPLLLLLVIPRRWFTTRRYCQAFAGLCLIGNGAYLGIGWIDRVGDAGDLMRRGTSHWVLVSAGLPMVTLGLWQWHRLETTVPSHQEGL